MNEKQLEELEDELCEECKKPWLCCIDPDCEKRCKCDSE